MKVFTTIAVIGALMTMAGWHRNYATFAFRIRGVHHDALRTSNEVSFRKTTNNEPHCVPSSPVFVLLLSLQQASDETNNRALEVAEGTMQQGMLDWLWVDFC